jgi:acyl-CoA thioesterase II
MTKALEILVVLSGTDVGAGKRTIKAARELCLGPPNAKHVSGGAQLAAIVALLEAQSERPLIEASIQFRASPPDGNEFIVTSPWANRGRSITQAEAHLSQDGKVLATALATLGARNDIGTFEWIKAPAAPPPDTCPPLPFIRMDEGDLHSHLGFRIANDPQNDRDGRLLSWVPWANEEPVPSAFLALIGDYLPEAIHFNIERPAGAISLDNKLRIIRRTSTRWLLCETQLEAVNDGLFHGSMSIFNENGALLAVASQSGVVRPL